MLIARDRLKSIFLSLSLLAVILLIWEIASIPSVVKSPYGILRGNVEYQELMGQTPGVANAAKGFPTPMQFFSSAVEQLRSPFHDNGSSDRGIGWQLSASLLRVVIGYGLAIMVAIPMGLVIGLNPTIHRAVDPFIQILKPISPLAWMPIALYTIKNAEECGIFVIFICSLWPVLINTAFGVASVKRDWINVARTLEMTWGRRITLLLIPAAAPTIITGMRIGLGIAWLAIVAAEMLVGSSGIGYFVWNQWNNLSIANVILAVILIGITGMLLDVAFGKLQKSVTYAE